MTKSNTVIFIVEDDPAFRLLIQKSIPKKYYKELRQFSDGKSCIESLREEKPDIVIQDFDLPDMNGLEIMKQVKNISPKSEFIFLSGQTNIKVAVETLHKGAFDYVVKDENTKYTIIHRLDKLTKIKNLEREKRLLKKGIFIFIISLLITFFGLIFMLFKYTF